MVIGGGRCRSLQLLFVFILLSLCMKPAVGLSTGDEDAGIKCIERERQALLMFKQGLINEYGHLSSWGNEDDKKIAANGEVSAVAIKLGTLPCLIFSSDLTCP